MKRCRVGIGLFFCAYCWTARAQDAAMFHGGQQHTGVYSTVGKAQLQKERWRFKTGNVNRSTPAVVGATVYVGSQTGILYAIEAASGNLKWEFRTASEITSSPAVAEKWVYINSDSGFFAVDAATGRQAWQIKTGEPVAFDHRWDYFSVFSCLRRRRCLFRQRRRLSLCRRSEIG